MSEVTAERFLRRLVDNVALSRGNWLGSFYDEHRRVLRVATMRLCDSSFISWSDAEGGAAEDAAGAAGATGPEVSGGGDDGKEDASEGIERKDATKDKEEAEGGGEEEEGELEELEEADAYDEERENSKNWARRTVILLWEKCTMLDDTAGTTDATDTTDACTLEGRPQVQVRILSCLPCRCIIFVVTTHTYT